MSEFSVMMMAVAFVGTILLSSRYCYLFILSHIAKREAAALHVSLQDVSFSFDQMVYFIALPTTIPEVRDAMKDELIIEPYYESHFFPDVNGIQVSVKSGQEVIPITYLPIDDFSLPILDRYLETRKIDERTNRIIRAHVIVHDRTLQAIRDEVYHHLHEDRIRQ
ncbi:MULTISPECIES: hypothetical protein [unclassified Exiguobacterium]|uniref:hypothetical protein n=1 Tax=unclassified Exiguobacterium TaxID=2644629 RepID=UPI00103C4D18|nr:MULTISPECIES: hypothetical protein [unclassified Exiguobacterium]TCI44225.1 hypothetical protein EVJ31_10240 [Exiguobacterium sp. SH5S32]TCI50491.1 hypothetical protein EVJ25_11205 [Exiguobacterium sp. SH1S4]TCI69449.1 hypothetical protein EVJ23_10230 [Exiguobacterium sp. SH1S1]